MINRAKGKKGSIGQESFVLVKNMKISWIEITIWWNKFMDLQYLAWTHVGVLRNKKKFEKTDI